MRYATANFWWRVTPLKQGGGIITPLLAHCMHDEPYVAAACRWFALHSQRTEERVPCFPFRRLVAHRECLRVTGTEREVPLARMAWYMQ